MIYSHGTDGKNCGNREFGARVHLQVPDQKYGDDAEGPVRNAGYRRVGVEGVDCNLRVDTGSFSTGVLGPEVGRWTTLQDKEKEEKRRVDFSDDYDCPDDDFVSPRHGNSKEENADAEFECHTGQDVDGFTCPPPLTLMISSELLLPVGIHYLQTHGELRRWNISGMLARSVMYAGDSKRTVDDEKSLVRVSLIFLRIRGRM